MTSGYPKKIVKPTIQGLMNASTSPRRRQAARRWAERRSYGLTATGAASAARAHSGNLWAARGLELVVDLFVEVRDSRFEIVHLAGLVVRDEAVDEILVRAADERDRRRPRVRVREDVEEDVELLVGLDVR